MNCFNEITESVGFPTPSSWGGWGTAPGCSCLHLSCVILQPKTPNQCPCPSSGSLFTSSLNGAHLVFPVRFVSKYHLFIAGHKFGKRALKGWCSEQTEFYPGATRITVCWWEWSFLTETSLWYKVGMYSWWRWESKVESEIFQKIKFPKIP